MEAVEGRRHVVSERLPIRVRVRVRVGVGVRLRLSYVSERLPIASHLRQLRLGRVRVKGERCGRDRGL